MLFFVKLCRRDGKKIKSFDQNFDQKRKTVDLQRPNFL